jgi:hypothetical protein
VKKKAPRVAFFDSPDLKGGYGTHAHWDKGGHVDIGRILGLDSRFAVNMAKEALTLSLKDSGGAYWERLSAGQIYGTIDVPGFFQEGRRDPKVRLDQFGVDLYGKTVLDMGSNAGAMSFEALNRGATHVRGLELLGPRVQTANLIARFAGIDDRVVFHKIDFNKDISEYQLPMLPADVVFAFAIDHQVESRPYLYDLLWHCTHDVLLFESSQQREFQTQIMRDLMEAGFKTVEYVGESTASDKKRRCRMCYRAYKERKVD